jgi:hypothetical protein
MKVEIEMSRKGVCDFKRNITGNNVTETDKFRLSSV